MVPASHLLTFTITASALIAIPGPSVLFVVGRAIAGGRPGWPPWRVTRLARSRR